MKIREIEKNDKNQLAKYKIGDLPEAIKAAGFNYIDFMSNADRLIYQLLTDKTNLILEITDQKVIISDGSPQKDVIYISSGNANNRNIEFISARVEIFGNNR